MLDFSSTRSNSPDPFGPNITTDLRTISRTQLSIEFQPRREVQISAAHRYFVQALHEEIKPWYRETFGREFEGLKLGEEREIVRQQFFRSEKFLFGVEILGLSEVLRDHPEYFNLPWWVEKGLAEYHWKRQPNGIEVTVTERHSIETQAIRQGVDRGIVPIVIVGIVRALPDAGSSEGYIVCGIRGGVHFRNVLMLPGGALKYDPKLITGQTSLPGLFVVTELNEELGLDFKHLKGGMPRLHSRHDDYLIDGRAALYIFDCLTSCSKEEIQEIWSANKHPDKQEHQALHFVPANPDSIRDFLTTSYTGRLRNNPARADTERFLSHHGALPLALEAGLTPAELRRLCRNEC